MIDLLTITVEKESEVTEVIFSSLYEVVGKEKEVMNWFAENSDVLLKMSAELTEIYNEGADIYNQKMKFVEEALK